MEYLFIIWPPYCRALFVFWLKLLVVGVRVEDAAPGDVTAHLAYGVAAEGKISSVSRPLAHERAEAAAASLLASLQPLGSGEAVRLQWIFVGAATPRPIRPAAKDAGSLSDFLNTPDSLDADALRAARLKQREPLLHAVVRLGIAAGDRPRVHSLFGRIWGTLRALNAPGAQVVRRWLPSSLVAERLVMRKLPVTRWPLLINAQELAGLTGIPIGRAALPGMPRPAARQLPPLITMPTSGTVVGVSTYPGMGQRLLALNTADRLRHTWCIGPTGTGKSTLLGRLITQDIEAGRGVVVLDPKGSLIMDVLERVPPSRHDDVVVLAPSETDYPLGLNLLDIGQGEHARELSVDLLVYLMSSLWRSSWGTRTSDVVRNALLTLTHTQAYDGSKFTLVELPELLLNPVFRRFVTAQPTVPVSVMQFWMAYEQMSDRERAQVIGPTLNKLRSLTTRTALRLMLGQSRGIRLDEAFTRRRIVLCSLAKGLLGTETTALVGSLVTAALWQAALARVALPREQRHPVMAYLDEFQDFLRLPIDLADMLSQSREFGLGLCLAHQYLDQLTDTVRTAVLGTARTQIAFQTELDDARTLAGRFAPLTAEDLSGLATYEIAMRPCVDGSTLPPVTGRTLPLAEPVTDGAALARRSRERFGRPRADVEAALDRRINELGDYAPRVGRERRGGHW